MMEAQDRVNLLSARKVVCSKPLPETSKTLPVLLIILSSLLFVPILGHRLGGTSFRDRNERDLFSLPDRNNSNSTKSFTVPLLPSLEQDHVTGKDIINTPNHNSSSGIPNMPFVEIPTGKIVRIGHVCENDSDCGNFSVCILKKVEDDTAVKICECDHNEMMRINHTCFIKPGHQCYFPRKNSHGYRFVQCLPGSECRSSVNRSQPESGYCMCNTDENSHMHDRDLNVEFEMSRCKASSFYLVNRGWEIFYLMGFLIASNFIV